MRVRDRMAHRFLMANTGATGLLLAVGLLVCVAFAAAAGPQAAAERACANAAADPDTQIRGCTEVLQQSSVSDNHGRAWAYTNRGTAYARKGDTDSAIKDYDKAIWLRPLLLLDIAHYYRGAAHAQKGDYQRAIRDYDEAGKLKRNTAAYQNARCWIRAVSNRDLMTALDLCNLALSLAPKSAATLDSRGFVYFRMGDMTKARADYDAALALTPKAAGSLFMRGVVRRRGGDTAAGDADIAAALTIDANVQTTYGLYGVTP